ncbi:MAG: histidine ammonia-lyase [Flavobacteriaceae bacterium]|nr:histidine ammonia-lyase [Flavobacteriaceae bacterium]
MKKFKIRNEDLTIDSLQNIINNNYKLILSKESIKNVETCRTYLDNKILKSELPIYGITTGFGSLHNITIENDQLNDLQHNLILSHACGIGNKIPNEVVKIMLLLKILTLSKGYSGIHLETINRLIFFYNNDILPIIFENGSLGASGDLSPLAHLSLPLIGHGDVFYKGSISSSLTVLNLFNLKPLKLKSKEGLALLNGTQFMSGFGLFLLLKAYKLSYLSDLISSISLESYNCKIDPFDPLIQDIRGHNGQSHVSKRIREFRLNSNILKSKKNDTQDPYSFRCIPQVHGATLDTINYCSNVILTEINSVNDNPIIFYKEDKIISGGNFHGQPLAYVLDFLKISLSELGNISERRIFKLISGSRGLPPFLVSNPGLNSGFMIPQYTAASLVSLNKQFASPSSTDSIVSSNGQEDHVSMGANSAILLNKVVSNVNKIIAIELFTSAQALDFKNETTSEFIREFINKYRENVDFVNEDKNMSIEINKTIKFLENYSIKNVKTIF